MKTVSYCLLFATAARAIDVYLHPAPILRSSELAVDTANLAISRHLGLESAEPLGLNGDVFGDLLVDQPFVGRGQKDGLVLTVDEQDARAILPTSLTPSFYLDAPPVESLESLTSTYLYRAAHVYEQIWSGESTPVHPSAQLLDLFSAPSPASDKFLGEFSTLSDFIESERKEGNAKFAALELAGLRVLADEYGRYSEQYTLATAAVRAAVESALAQPELQLVLLTFDSTEGSMSVKRQAVAQPPSQSPLPIPSRPSEPIDSQARCFTSADACTNATDTCSGHGQCVAGKRAGQTCYVCACGATKDTKGRTLDWAGVKCERRDVSGPFVLLTGTVIALLLFVGGSIALLYSVGGDELPGTLTGAAPGSKRD